MSNIDNLKITTKAKKTSSGKNDEQGNGGHLNSLVPLSDSWCQDQSNLIRFSHTWSIENFTLRLDNNISVSDPLSSSEFFASSNGRYKFSLSLYPNQDHVSFYLKMCSGGRLYAGYRFAIIDADGVL